MRAFGDQRRRRRERWTVGCSAVKGVIEDVLDAVDGNGGVNVEVRVGNGGGVEGEIGVGVKGDEDGVGGQEGGEAGEGFEEFELGEKEALGDDVVRYEERVEGDHHHHRRGGACGGTGEVGEGFVGGDQEGGLRGE